MQKITPFLWFDDQAEEAAELLRLRVQREARSRRRLRDPRRS